MSQATSTATSGGVYFADPNAGQSNLWLFGIIAAALVIVVALFKRK